MSNQEKQKHAGFKNLGIKPSILAVLKKLGLENPTPIQAKAIPIAVLGKDLFGIAQTGTGKTLAFGVPTIQRLAEVKGRALVLLPTRELANQVEESLRNLGKDLGLRTVSVIGGEAIGRQLFTLRKNPHVIVATPGRLLDHIKRKTIKLDDISVLVLDEADMMFDLGFAPQIEEIIKLTPVNRQTLLFSATMPAAVIKLAEKYLKTPLRIEVAPAGTTADLVEQEIYLIRNEDRFGTLEKILLNYKNLVLIFVRTKYGAANLTRKLRLSGHQASEIHSNLSFNQRKTALAGFKSGARRILVATDVAARGLDINDIELVLNFDLPSNSEDYVHRIGRTARAGKGGKAISFAMPNQRREIQRIERLIKKNLPVTKIGTVQSEVKKSLMTKVQDGGRRGGSRFRPKSAPNFSISEDVDKSSRFGQKTTSNFSSDNDSRSFSRSRKPKSSHGVKSNFPKNKKFNKAEKFEKVENKKNTKKKTASKDKKEYSFPSSKKSDFSFSKYKSKR